MNLLKDKIRTDGHAIGNNILKVDSFLNHQLDVELLNEIGKAFHEKFKEDPITKILTIEASGIALAVITAQYFDNIPVVFAKKTESLNLDEDLYTSEVYSFTKDKTYKLMVSKKYVNRTDKILIIDDFLANGKSILGLKEIIDQANATLVGAGIVIEKGFQEGGDIIRDMGIKVESLAIIDCIEDGVVKFRD